MVIGEDVGWAMHWATTLVKKRPFTPDEVRHLAAMIERNPKLDLVYVPRVLPPSEQAALEAKAFSRHDQTFGAARKAYAGLFTAASTSPAAVREFEQRYPYRIDPTYDDRPFFFEYYKSGRDVAATKAERGFERSGLNSVRGDAGRYVLLALLIAATTVGAVSMLGPLLIFERQGLKARGIFPLIGAVAFIGLAFMAIEIGLMQLLTLFVGDPTSTMAVVLAGLLFFTGIGSLLAGRLGRSEEWNIIFGVTGSALLAVLVLPAVHYLLPYAELLPFAGRSAIVLAMLAPLGLAMGFPFASLVRYLGAQYERFVPWAWGINGLASVVASVAAIMGAMRLGFGSVMVGGAVLYLASLAMFLLHRKAARLGSGMEPELVPAAGAAQ
jgi:hypothetical protein